MDSSSPTLTDPATELYEFCSALRKHAVGEATFVALAKYFGVGYGTPEFHIILSAVMRRFARIGHLVAHDPLIDPDIKSDMPGVLKTLSSFLSLEHGRGPWPNISAQSFTPEAMKALRYLAPQIKDRHSFKRIDEGDRVRLIQELQAFVQSLDLITLALSPAVRIALRDAFADCLFVLERLFILGSSELRDRLLVADSTLRAAKHHAHSRGAKRDFWKIAATAAGLLYGISDAMFYAQDVYEFGVDGPGQLAVDYVRQSLADEVKALPPPDPKVEATGGGAAEAVQEGQ